MNWQAVTAVVALLIALITASIKVGEWQTTLEVLRASVELLRVDVETLKADEKYLHGDIHVPPSHRSRPLSLDKAGGSPTD